ncbi:LOW QUALITY PROTEIN: hypothetical protein Cgig2_017154 [Carnegiea gigantea]|uniref:Uncharacterized protein n=1 Tax=Carnegiea gigantea TaxID=171969 RepID=A0A9Q1GHD9_9CARY|nr:LOW QUALITY PROTEIN: hypothetical protein Cgig2_017154 [Carnegiea gigantea]
MLNPDPFSLSHSFLTSDLSALQLDMGIFQLGVQRCLYLATESSAWRWPSGGRQTFSSISDTKGTNSITLRAWAKPYTESHIKVKFMRPRKGKEKPLRGIHTPLTLSSPPAHAPGFRASKEWGQRMLEPRPTAVTKKSSLKYNNSRDSIEQFPITRFEPPAFGFLAPINYARHEGWQGLRLVIIPSVILKVPSSSPFLGCRLPKRVLDQLAIVPVRDVSPTDRPMHKEKIILPFRLFSTAIVKPFRLLKLYQPITLASLSSFCTVCTNPNVRAKQVSPFSSQVTTNVQILCHDVGTICTGAFILVDDIHDYLVEGKSHVVHQGRLVYRDTVRGNLLTIVSTSGRTIL